MEYKNGNYPESSEAETQKVQTCVIRDREQSDAFFQFESRGSMKSAQQAEVAAMSFDEQKSSTATKEDLKQNTTDIPARMQRQVLVILKAQRTVDVPLLQYSDTTVDVPVAKDAEKTTQKQHEDCMTKYNEIQMDKRCVQHISGPRTRSRMSSTVKVGATSSFTVQKDTEVIHREVKGGTKINCYLKENQSEFSETRRLEDLVKKTIRIRYQNGSRVMRGVTLTTPAKTVVRRRNSHQNE